MTDNYNIYKGMNFKEIRYKAMTGNDKLLLLHAILM